MRLPGVSLSAVVIRLPGSRALDHLETPALFAPHVLHLHGCFALGCEIQVLLSQMCSQLPDLKLEWKNTQTLLWMRRDERKNSQKGTARERSYVNRLHLTALSSIQHCSKKSI